MKSPAILRARCASFSVESAVLLAPTSLTIGSGQCLMVKGPNGAGKTTLLRMLAGVVRPTAGDVTLDGVSLDERVDLVRRRMSVLIGVPARYGDLTLGEHLALIRATWGLPGGSVGSEAVNDGLEVFEIGHLRDRFPHEVSSGQGQLFDLAAAFIRPFDVLILDEPEQRLDPDRKRLLGAAISSALAVGATVVCASHDAGLRRQLATQTVDLT